MIASPGDDVASLFVVASGRVKGSIPAPDSDVQFTVGIFWPGDVFGELGVFGDGPLAGNCVALTEVEIVAVSKRELNNVLVRRPLLAIRFIENLCDKLRTALRFTLALSYLDVRSRLYLRLHYLGRFDAIRDDNGVRIQHGLSQRELADSIGASREALNKLLGEWKRAGLIDYGRGSLVVRDATGLAMRMPPRVRQDVVFEATPSSSLGTWPLDGRKPGPMRSQAGPGKSRPL